MANKLALFSAKPYDKEFFDEANRSYGFEIKYFEAPLTPDTIHLSNGCQVVCLFVNDHIAKEEIDALYAKGVRLIALRCAGYDNVDLKAAHGKLKIVRVPSYSPVSIAEHAVGMMLSLNRKLHLAHLRVKNNNFSITGLLGFEMHGKTVGVIGCGQIGKSIIPILRGFGMQVLVYDADPAQCEKVDARAVDLQTLCNKSDIITLHCALSSDNFHMINEKTIEWMRDGVMLINTGRGGLIDSTALIAALKVGKIGAVGLDVYERERGCFYKDLSLSFVPDDTLARLQSFSNVLITSHQAYFTKEALQNITHTTLESVHDFFAKKTLANEVHD